MEGLLSDKLAVSADKWVLADQVADFEPIYKIIIILNKGKDIMAKVSDSASIKKKLDTVEKS